MNVRTTSITILLLSAALSIRMHAQWLDHRAKGVPRTADGKVDMSAKAPRASDGKPDFSGVGAPRRRRSTS